MRGGAALQQCGVAFPVKQGVRKIITSERVRSNHWQPGRDKIRSDSYLTVFFDTLARMRTCIFFGCVESCACRRRWGQGKPGSTNGECRRLLRSMKLSYTLICVLRRLLGIITNYTLHKVISERRAHMLLAKDPVARNSRRHMLLPDSGWLLLKWYAPKTPC